MQGTQTVGRTEKTSGGHPPSPPLIRALVCMLIDQLSVPIITFISTLSFRMCELLFHTVSGFAVASTMGDGGFVEMFNTSYTHSVGLGKHLQQGVPSGGYCPRGLCPGVTVRGVFVPGVLSGGRVNVRGSYEAWPSARHNAFCQTRSSFSATFYPRDVVSAVFALATWLDGWLAGCRTPVLYQNG